MARTRKSIQPLNLYKYDVLIEDRGTRSDYFKITQFDGYFYGGRNAFLIAGTSTLKPNSKILVEVLNVNNETIFSAPISNFVEGSSRLIQIEVYSDTPPGPGKLVVLGSTDTYLDGSSVPAEWKDKYNVRWISDVIISPRVNNKTPIRFQKTPSIFVTEKFYTAPSSSQFTETISVPVDVEISPKYFNVFPNGYIISLKGPSTNTFFNNEYFGGKLSGSVSFTGSNGVETASINLPISKIYNKNTAETIGSLVYTTNDRLISNIYLSASGQYSSSVNLGTNQIINSNLNLVYSKLDTQLTGSNISFAEIRLVDLGTLSGEINKVRLSFKKSTSPGEYVILGDIDTGVKELLSIDSGSAIVDTGNFKKIKLNDYWYSATMSLQKNEISPSIPTYYVSSSLVLNNAIYENDVDILGAISATPVISNGGFVDGKSYFIGTTGINSAEIFPRSEYTLAFNAFVSKTSGSTVLIQNDYSLEVYLVSQEGNTSKILTTNALGQLIGTLTPSSTFQKQNFERVELNFTPQIIVPGNYGVRFVVYGGHWSISDVSLKVAQEPFFSPDEINLLLPIQNDEQDILTFKADFLDVDNNTAGESVFSIPTYFTGSSDYVKKAGDFMTGELYINGLPIQQQALQDGFTGLVSGGIITVNTPASWSYTISSGSGYVIDNYTNPLSPSYTYVTWPEISKMPAAFTTTGSVASYPRTNIAISASGQVIEQSAEWTPYDYRRYIILGRIAHVGTTFIQRALSLPLTTYNRGFHWFDLANAIGIINVTGNVFYPSGSSMRIGKTAGQTYRVGSNYRNDTTYPDITTDPASLPTSFAYRYRSGSGFAEEPITTFITGTLYDNGSGTLQTVNPNKFTVQRIYYFGATNTTRIQFGQNIYNTMLEAQEAALSEVFTVDANLERDASLRTYLIVGSSTTDLSNLAEAEFISAGKFGGGTGGGGGGGGATTLSGLTDVNLSGSTSGQLLQYNGSVWVNGTNVSTLATTGSNIFVGNQSITGSLILSSSLPTELIVIGDTEISGSLRMLGGITSSLFGTSSWANSASFAISSSRSVTASFAVSSSWAISSSVAISASTTITSSYVIPTGLPIGTISSSGQVDHNSTTNYSVNRHIDHTAVSIVAGTGLVGGGDISSTRTITALFIPSTDNRSVNNPPASASAGLYADFKTNTTDGLVDGGTYHGVLTFRPYGTTSDFSGGPAYQEAFTENGNAYLRSGSSNTWSSWRKFAYETGSLLGTSSYASTASVAISASWAPAAGLTGGTTNYIPLWTGTGTLSSSAIYQNTGNVGIGTTAPQKVLEVISPVNDFVSVGVSQMGTGQWSGIHFGYREGNTSYRKSAIVFERTDLTGPNAQGKVHILNGPQAGAGSATLSDAKFTIAENGNVGIGTTTPQVLLDITGSNPTTRILGASGTTPRLTLSSAGVTAWSFRTSGSDSSFRLDQDGTDRITVLSGGNVGIGTTSPDTNLSVVKSSGGLPASSGTTPTNAITRIKASANNAMFMGMDTSSPYSGWIQVSDITGLGTNYPILLNPNGGNVGVGTTSPSYKLDVNGATRLGDGGARPTVIETNGMIYSNGDTGGWAFGHQVKGSSGTDRGGFGFYGGSNNLVYYYIGADYITPTMVIQSGSTGRVGIGTTTPNGTLDITSLLADGGTALILRTSNSTTANGTIRWRNSAGTNQAGIGSNFNVSDVGALEFLNNTTTNMIIRSSGNVGIGTSAPSASLHVQGNVSASSYTGSFNATGPTYLQTVIEKVVGTDSAPPTTVNYDVLNGAILFYSGSATANWTLNFRGNASTTLNSMMPVSSSMTVTLLTRTTTAYSSSAYQIDGTSITPRWQNGVSGSGNANSLDAHTFTIIKTSSTPTYILLGSITRYT